MLVLSSVGCILDRTRWLYAYSAGQAADATAQAQTWATFADCQGTDQSPIDVQTRRARLAPELNEALVPHIKRHIPLLLNTGHYFELDKTTPQHLVRLQQDVTASPGEGDKGWSKIHNTTYKFYQVHWHVPSENRIDGKQFAMEAHYVHQLDSEALVGTNEALAVIAVMYELSDGCNEELEEFWAVMPMTLGDAPFDRVVDIGSWLAPLLPGGYFSWTGSLTTPPCSEGVTWNLLKRASHVCLAQVDRLKAALRAVQQGVEINNRVVQPLHGRVIKMSTAAAQTSTTAPSSSMRLFTEIPSLFSARSAQAFMGAVATATIGAASLVMRQLRRCRSDRISAGYTGSTEETGPLCLA